ncbi:phosphate/phosphite/phosphonate ABC transporter substrate-binding protein [Bradyrhizobium sp.]|uniref:phosphate/phosphite/phosphonate ABC transporter substrate-binding protein n=1 Tax=Bradyrhizobium sp. TaxID=376 RepID=UPI003C407734
MAYIANARMYSVDAAAALAWRELFSWLSRASGVDLDIIDHAFPLPLSELWSRADLACVFMCGLPYSRAARPPRPVAAPVPAQAPIPGLPVYATYLVVPAVTKFLTLEDTFGGRLGYTVDGSHSGYNALRHHLLPYYRARRARLYRESIGPLYTPRRVIDALLSGDIDVGPLDSYALDLMLHHQPDLAPKLRIVAATDPAPIPFLVAAPDCAEDVVSRLQTTLATFASAPACAGLRDRLCLEAFTPVVAEDYHLMTRWDAEARIAGYPEPG